MNKLNRIHPHLQGTRIYRQVSFDLGTFDALQVAKRTLCGHWEFRLTNSEVLRTFILSHPFTLVAGGSS